MRVYKICEMLKKIGIAPTWTYILFYLYCTYRKVTTQKTIKTLTFLIGKLYLYYKIRTGKETEDQKISDNIHSSTILKQINLKTIWTIYADHKYSINKKKQN